MSPNMRRAVAAVITTWLTVAGLLAVVFLGTGQLEHEHHATVTISTGD